MNNSEIAGVLGQVADLLEFQKANPFRVRAYRSGARRVKDFCEPVAQIVADPDRELTDLEGIGKDLAQKIALLVTTGQLPMLDELLTQIPKSVLALLRIPGLGPKKAALLYNELQIVSLDMLRAACEAKQVRTLPGFGEKTEAMILAGIDLAAMADQRIYWSKAEAIVERLLAHMQSLDCLEQMEIAGSYRRGQETVGDLDLLLEPTDCAKDHETVMDHFGQLDGVQEVIGRGETKMSVRLASGLQIDLRVVPGESFGAALQYFTGSKEHNVKLRGLAKERGMKINEYGLFRVEEDRSETYVAGRTEEEVYGALDLPRFPPELREAREEFSQAAEGTLPKLIELADIRGDLHMHTTESDGKASLREMVAAAQARGLSYIAITDHSKRVSMARGLDSKRLRAQWEEIDLLNRELDDFLILKGIECDILEKGGMDLPDDVLAEGDWVIASIHYGQNQPRAQITERILSALENPHVSILAHPTGRLINRREPYDVDWEQVFATARREGKWLELNANPARLDLNDIHCAAAKRNGVPLVISSDAHNTAGLDVLRHGIRQARRGGLTAQDVANTQPWPWGSPWESS